MLKSLFVVHWAAMSDSQMENQLCLIHVAPIKGFHTQIKEHRKMESGGRENTPVGLLSYYMSAFFVLF